MTIRTKTIGRLPQNKSEWDPNYVNPGTGQRGYGQKFRVFRYGCELESKIENNTYDPFDWDGDQNFVLDVAHWELCSGNPKVWAAGNPKPASTGTTGDYPYNGMGRVVLEKNMVNVGTSENPDYVDQLTQDMFYKGEVGSRVPNTDTIFVIQYDFVLGEDITVPANCVLEFEGGSLSGGTIIGNNTKFKDNVKFNNVDFSGSFSIPVIRSSWFSDITQNNKINLLFKLCSNSIHNIVIIESGEYTVSIPSSGGNAVYVQNKHDMDIIINGHLSLVTNDYEVYNILHFDGCHDIRISGSGIIEGDRDEHTGSGTYEWGHCLRINNGCYNIDISGITLKKCTGDALNIGRLNSTMDYCHEVTVHNIIVDNPRRNGVVIGNSYNVTIKNCFIQNVSGVAPQIAVDVEPNDGTAYNIYIENIHIKNTPVGVSTYIVGDAVGVFENINVKNIYCDNVGTPIGFSNCKNALVENVYSDNGATTAIVLSRGSYVKIINSIFKNIANYAIEQDFSSMAEFESCQIETTGDLLAKANTSAGKLQFTNSTLKFNTINGTDDFYNHIACYNCTIDGSFAKKVENSVFDSCNITTDSFGLNSNTKARNIQLNNCTVASIGFCCDNLKLVGCTFNQNTTSFQIGSSTGVKVKGCVINAIGALETIMDIGSDTDITVEGCEFVYSYSDPTKLKRSVLLQNSQRISLLNNKYANARDVFNISATDVIMKQDNMYPNQGTTRPSFNAATQFTVIGFRFFDTNLSPARPVFWNGSAWVDAAGATV